MAVGHQHGPLEGPEGQGQQILESIRGIGRYADVGLAREHHFCDLAGIAQTQSELDVRESSAERLHDRRKDMTRLGMRGRYADQLRVWTLVSLAGAPDAGDLIHAIIFIDPSLGASYSPIFQTKIRTRWTTRLTGT